MQAPLLSEPPPSPPSPLAIAPIGHGWSFVSSSDVELPTSAKSTPPTDVFPSPKQPLAVEPSRPQAHESADKPRPLGPSNPLDVDDQRATPQRVKRKRSGSEDGGQDDTRRYRGGLRKKKPISRQSRSDARLKAARIDPNEIDPISHWAESGEWPENYASMSQDSTNNPTKRRRSRTSSYSQGVRDGINPRAHTPGYETVLQRYGIMFNDIDTGAELGAESKALCQTLLDTGNNGDAYFSMSKSQYLSVWQRAKNGNEERVRRDLTPLIVPSAELLYLVDGEAGLEHVAEEISVEWSKCQNLGGTTPKPDLAVGLSHTTFTDEEKAKLQDYSSVACPPGFTDALFFPFLLCEAKCGRRNINDAYRQNVHSASIAVKAIVQLHRAVSEELAESLSGQILVFSVSHDNERVKIYGHFPLVRGAQITFHKYYVDNYTLDGHYGRDWDKGPNFTRALYRTFYPLHVQRLRNALALLQPPMSRSAVSAMSVDDVGSQASGPSSRDSGTPGRPLLHRAKSQGELTVMKQQMARMEEMHKTQIERLEETHKAQIERLQTQLDVQDAESRAQMEMLQR